MKIFLKKCPIASFLLVSIVAFVSCMEETPMKEEVINVQHYPIVKNNDVDNPTLWLRVQFSHQKGTDEWSEIAIHDIEGFNYEIGNNYELSIRKEEAYHSASDMYYVKYTLLSEISKEPVSSNTTFEIPLKSSAYNPTNLVYGSVELGYKLLGEIPIICTSLCNDLESNLATNAEVAGVFKHEGDGYIKLIQLK
ncbi:DUF4377 domain-containing protein [Echinicola sp. CAU 1574]|uniref:DUF4377 domain-containing protein n=1 Tax=Echinicola arenosa TaxID=2774144 RepID=A0ABR9AH48_9BACT|nr:DUF4377 domain-containing protein [Echinicola arenosa]MBD8487158.1 DUF4377 domain-containing protein [Echinicola arenosa]